MEGQGKSYFLYGIRFLNCSSIFEMLSSLSEREREVLMLWCVISYSFRLIMVFIRIMIQILKMP